MLVGGDASLGAGVEHGVLQTRVHNVDLGPGIGCVRGRKGVQRNAVYANDLVCCRNSCTTMLYKRSDIQCYSHHIKLIILL